MNDYVIVPLFQALLISMSWGGNPSICIGTSAAVGPARWDYQKLVTSRRRLITGSGAIRRNHQSWAGKGKSVLLIRFWINLNQDHLDHSGAGDFVRGSGVGDSAEKPCARREVKGLFELVLPNWPHAEPVGKNHPCGPRWKLEEVSLRSELLLVSWSAFMRFMQLKHIVIVQTTPSARNSEQPDHENWPGKRAGYTGAKRLANLPKGAADTPATKVLPSDSH